MGCGNNDLFGGFSDDENCVCQVLRAIKDIQDAATDDDCDCPTNCFMEPMGALVNPAKRINADTRVFVLKTKDGSPFHAFFTGHEDACVSIFFRVEEIFDNCCATLRVLVPLKKQEGSNQNKFKPVDLVGDKGGINLGKVCEATRFAASEDCITVDLSCFCAVQCITDCDLGICED